MKSSWRDLLRIRAGEENLFAVLAYILFANFMALEMSSVVATSGFLSEAGIELLPLIWIVDMAILLFVGTLQSLIIDRIERLRLMRYVVYVLATVHFGLLLLFSFGAANSATYALLYILADQQLFFVPVVFWVLANDKMSVAQSRRLFPTIAAVGFLGQIAGLALSSLGGVLLDGNPRPLLLVNVLVYLPCLWLIRRLDMNEVMNRPVATNWRENLREGWDFIWNVKAFRFLMLAMLAVGTALTLIEFHFLVVTAASFDSAAGYQTFFGSYRLALAILTVLVQSLVTSRLIDRLTLPRALFILPATILLAALSLLAAPGLVLTALGRGGARLGLATVDESARKSLQGLIPPARRGRVSLFLDNYVFAVGISLGALIVWGLMALAPASGMAPLYLGATALLAGGALVSIGWLNRTYEASLLNWRLKRRNRGRSVLDTLDFSDEKPAPVAAPVEVPAVVPVVAPAVAPTVAPAVAEEPDVKPVEAPARRRRRVANPLDLID
ncbi:MAG: hypothetical protein KDE59_32910 [Anaerolineales bacterium]|nr:hypothetical protein [Anaerolineales bacterium]